jgi:hypothetical protein
MRVFVILVVSVLLTVISYFIIDSDISITFTLTSSLVIFIISAFILNRFLLKENGLIDIFLKKVINYIVTNKKQLLIFSFVSLIFPSVFLYVELSESCREIGCILFLPLAAAGLFTENNGILFHTLNFLIYFVSGGFIGVLFHNFRKITIVLFSLVLFLLLFFLFLPSVLFIL